MEFKCIIFSLEKPETCIYEFSNGTLPILSKKSSNLDKNKLLDDCRSLLHTTYVEEQQWNPPTDNGTQFNLRKSKTGSWMLCDRYDESSSYWVCILNNNDELVACCRLLYKDYDVLNYSSLGTDIKTSLLNMKTLVEAQRATVSMPYRKYSLFMYLYYFTCLFSYQEIKSNGVFTTQSVNYMISFSKSIGLENPQGWHFKYKETDEISYIMIIHPLKAVINIKNRLNSKL